MRLLNCPNKLTIFRVSKNGLREAKIKSVLTVQLCSMSFSSISKLISRPIIFLKDIYLRLLRYYLKIISILANSYRL